MTTKLTPQQKKTIRKVTEALKDSMISMTIDDLVNATGSSPTIIKNTLAKIEGVKQDENGYYLPRDDHELNAVAVNIQEAPVNLQDKELNTQAPHVSPPSNDGATYVSEPCNDVLFPRFEVGQKAYCPWLNDGELVTLGLDDNGDLIAQTKKGLQAFDCEGYALDCTPRQPDLFPATDYYSEHLSAIMPWIEFEQPPKELTGSELAKALLKKGWVGFNCLCGHSGDENAITDTIVTGINNDGKFTTIDGRLFSNAIPMKGWRPLKAQEVGL